MIADTSRSPYAAVWGLPCGAAELKEGFWKECQELCARVTVYQIREMFEGERISHVVENFRICAGEKKGIHRGTPFGDGDFYKWLEAVIFCGAYGKDDVLSQMAEEYIDLIGRAQRQDGYLSTKQIIAWINSGENCRMQDINAFEVYNFGHLFTAACLHHRVTGRDNFLRIAEKAARYLQQLFSQAQERGGAQTAVCPSHYMGLVELYRTTGKKKYLDMALMAVGQRDMVKEGTDDNQDRIPLLEQKEIIGHAVRANYLYAGVADLYAEIGRPEYLCLLHRMWSDLTTKKIYLTGGCGALYNGVSPYGDFFHDQKVHQAYGYAYQLPNLTAYNETCASVGGVMWAYRMFIAEPKGEYFDWIERMMYNVNLAAVSLDGKRFFYENMLQRSRKLKLNLPWPLERKEYISSFCCPPNLARLLSQIQEYFYMTSEDCLWIGMYGASKARCRLNCGAEFTICQETEYPYQGLIRFSFPEVLKEGSWRLKLRIPQWAERGWIEINGRRRKLRDGSQGGFEEIFVERTEGTEIRLNLEMPVRLTAANSMAEEIQGCLAVERGPLVYCMESQDAEDSLEGLCLPAAASFAVEERIIAGRKIQGLCSRFIRVGWAGKDEDKLYQRIRKVEKTEEAVHMIPYFAWDNRGMGEMRVWFPAAF